MGGWTLSEIVQLLLNGLAAGCIYGLVALGFVLIYKATEMVNFAQGDLLMLGAFMAFALIEHYSMNYWAAFLGAVLFMGGMSMVVWAHHMFLTGMSTSLGTFFQVTTFIISIPSVILLSALVLTLWGGSITFSTPMLFALAFLPMFGLGGLTGLPLGLAASDVTLHDTWYVVAHFHYLVAPGTVFARCNVFAS